MRRLDESLTKLAERGEPVGADVLIDRVEQRLALGSDPVVVAIDPRRTDMQTQHETPSPTRTRGPLIAVAAFASAVLIAVAALVVIQLTEQESLVAGQPPGPLEEFVEAIQAGDTEKVDAMLSISQRAFPRWLIGLDASGIEFTDCEAMPSNRIVCSVSMGPDWFYSRIVGYPLQTTFAAQIGDERILGPEWPTPEGLVEAEAEFEAWVLATYPERYDTMFVEAPFGPENIKFGTESGMARSELLDEFLASR